MRIGLDLDGVIVDSIPYWIAALNERMGAGHSPHDLPETHTTPDRAAFFDRYEVELLIVPPPVQGAIAALNRLSSLGHELVVITARHPRLRGLTQAWLDYHGARVDRLHFLEGAPKAPAAKAEGIGFLVEDTPHNALAVADAGIPVLLFDAPYNRHVSHPLVEHCQGWEAILRRILEASAA